MRHSNFVILILAVVSGTAFAASGKRTGLSGQVLELHTNLGVLAEQLGVTQGDIGLVQTIDLGVPGSWASGLIGAANHKNFYLSPVQTKGAPGTLHISYSSPKTPLVVEECAGAYAGAKCSPVAVTQNGAISQLTAGDSRWDLELMGNPCATGLACDFYLPSWLLANRAANPATGDSPFPRLFTAVEIKGRSLCFLATESGTTYFCLNLTTSRNLPDLGALRSVSGEASGLVVLDFAAGAVALDFATDRTWLLDTDTVGAGTTAIAELGEAPFATVAAHPGAGAFKALTSDVAVWENGYLPSWREASSAAAVYAAMPGRVAQAGAIAASAASPGDVSAVIAVQDQWQLSTYGSEGWSPKASMAAVGVNLPAGLAFTTAGLLLADTQDIKSLAGGKVAKASLTGGNGAVIFPDGSAFAQDGATPCNLVHYEQNPADPAAFLESGLKVPCTGGVTAYGFSRDRVVVTVRNGFSVTSYVLAR